MDATADPDGDRREPWPRGQHRRHSRSANVLEAPEDAVEPLPRPVTVLLVPDVGGGARSAFIDSIATSGTVIGPARPWLGVKASVHRVLRALELSDRSDPPLDTDDRLAELVVRADPEALADLRERVLAPMRHLRPRAPR